jgi:GntR family transcriptional repressor for pyruvate dehydrogenase complex
MTTSSEAIRAQLEPVRRRKIYAEVASQIHRLIADGRLKPGDRLPAERELAGMLGVSRTSVRDAIRILELQGIVEPRQGEGTLVTKDPVEGVVNPLAGVLAISDDLTADLFDLRKIIEPALARVAALRATEDDLEALEEIIARQAGRVRAGEIAIEEDTEFHYRLATVSKNRVVPRVMDVLMNLLRESRARSLQGKRRSEKSLEGHRRILDAIRRRDGEEAALSMQQHIEEIEAILFRTPASGGSFGLGAD